MIEIGKTYLFVKSGSIVRIISKHRELYKKQHTFTALKPDGKRLLVTESGLIDFAKLQSLAI